MLWYYNAVDGTVLLVGHQTVVYRIVVVENLYLHAVVGGVGAEIGSHAHAVVHSRSVETEIEAQHEVAVLLLCVEVAAAAIVCRDVYVAVLRYVVGGVALPFIERTAVEQHLVALLLLVGRKPEHRSGGQLADACVSNNERVVACLEADAAHSVNALALFRVLENCVCDEFLAVDAYEHAVVNHLYVG